MNGDGRRGQLYTLAATLLLAAVTVASATAILRFADAERARDVAAWRARLGIVADSRLTQAQGWLDAQLGEMRALAENQSVQIYMTELDQAQGNRAGVTDEPAQIGYLRNLLIVTAERAGFGGARGAAVGANVRRTGSGGIALLNARGVVLAASPNMPPIDAPMQQRLAALPGNRPGVIDLYRGAAGQPTLGFMAPVFAVQADPGTSERIGYVLGLAELGDAFFRLLKQPGATESSAEALVLRKSGNTIEYLSPQADGTPSLGRSAPADAGDLAEARAAAAPGGFLQARDYRGKDVLAVSRAFVAVPWVLLYKVDRDEALADADRRRRNLIAGLGLVVALIAAGFVAVWWYASSRRASEAAARYRALAGRYERQESLLRGITDSQPDLIYLVDGDGRIGFANAAAGKHGGVAAEDLIGKTLPAALGPEHAATIDKENKEALGQGASKTRLMRFDAPGGLRVAQISHVPLGTNSVVVVERDVTELVGERERRARAMNQVVDMLVKLIERRDPYCADQAQRVGQVAGAIAEAMQADAQDRATVALAARLMNLGKVLVPTEVLTKTTALSDAEKKLVHDSILSSADFLKGIEFDGPVQATLSQLQERVDGAGTPAGLKGEAILLPARILAVANAFVGMVSPRAWRGAIGIDQAVEMLRQDRDRFYDRHVVAALEHALENKGGRAAWQGFAARPAGAPA